MFVILMSWHNLCEAGAGRGGESEDMCFPSQGWEESIMCWRIWAGMGDGGGSLNCPETLFNPARKMEDLAAAKKCTAEISASFSLTCYLPSKKKINKQKKNQSKTLWFAVTFSVIPLSHMPYSQSSDGGMQEAGRETLRFIVTGGGEVSDHVWKETCQAMR